MDMGTIRKVLAGLEPFTPERPAKIEIDDNLELVLDKITAIYEKNLDEGWRNNRSSPQGFFYKCFLGLKNLGISKEAFNRFFASLPAYSNQKNFYENTGLFVSVLLQATYVRGCNDFELDTRPIEKNIDWLLTGLRGSEKERLRVSVIGNLGFCCCTLSTNASINVKGNTGRLFAHQVRFCDIQLSGEAKDLGNRASHLYLRVFGKAENTGRAARNSTFVVFGEPGKYAMSRSMNSVLKCTSLEALERVRRNTPKCELYYLQDNGAEVSYDLAKKSIKSVRGL